MYDIAIIGGGPGGYVCAIRAAQLGLKTALIEKRIRLGGTCLNVGCIPSKAWLDSSELFHTMRQQGKSMGVLAEGLRADVATMQKRKEQVVEITCKGIDALIKKNKIDRFIGEASFLSATTLRIQGETETQLNARNIVIATGSTPSRLPFQIDHPRVVDSTAALDWIQAPATLAIIGGGVIGLELGSVWARLGTQVTIVEALPALLPSMDSELALALQKHMAKTLGIQFLLQTRTLRMEASDSGVLLDLETQGQGKQIQAEYCLVATGRRPYTEGLQLSNAGLKPDERGRIPVDEKLRTSVPGLWAIGDVVPGPMLAHKAEEDGVYVAETIAGAPAHLNYRCIPGVVYTDPEFASVGETEEQLKARQANYKVGKFPFRASGRARAAQSLEGMAKVLSDAISDEILGIHILGPRAADLIAEAVVAMEYRATAEDLGRICHAHPTFSEALKEAALAASANRAIHM